MFWEGGLTLQFILCLTQPSAMTLLYLQSGDPVYTCRFLSEWDEWMRSGLRDEIASKFRHGRPDLATKAPVCVISFSSDFGFSVVLGFFLKGNKKTFEGSSYLQYAGMRITVHYCLFSFQNMFYCLSFFLICFQCWLLVLAGLVSASSLTGGRWFVCP